MRFEAQILWLKKFGGYYLGFEELKDVIELSKSVLEVKLICRCMRPGLIKH